MKSKVTVQLLHKNGNYFSILICLCTFTYTLLSSDHVLSPEESDTLPVLQVENHTCMHICVGIRQGFGPYIEKYEHIIILHPQKKKLKFTQ